MHEAMLYDKLANSRAGCNICQWHCQIAPDKTGVCGMYRNLGGILYNMNYARASSVAVDPIEKKPLNHFFPGSRVFSLGGWGCNFHCLNCQNWQISCLNPDFAKPGADTDSQEISPENAIKTARDSGCSGIAWTYNEPTMWFEYTLDSARLAKQEHLYTVYVTNGYMSPEALDAIGPYLDAFRVDLKGFSDDFYQKIAKVPHWKGILEVAERAISKWHMHVEVVTNIIPEYNDDSPQLEAMASWIKEKLGELTPWHVTRFYPQYRLTHLAPTPVATLEKALKIGQQAGLKFVYAGNIPGHASENTVCYSCGRTVVERYGYQVQVTGLNGSKCRYCNARLNFRTA
jgi:pyruvate formate lyase activating enzyme